MSLVSSLPPAGPTVIVEQSDWLAEAERRFGISPRGWKFKCPACGYVQCIADFLAAGITQETAITVVNYSCIGRWIGGLREAIGGTGPGPCNYAGGGLFMLHPIRVRTPASESLPAGLVASFAFADEAGSTAEDARLRREDETARPLCPSVPSAVNPTEVKA